TPTNGFPVANSTTTTTTSSTATAWSVVVDNNGAVSPVKPSGNVPAPPVGAPPPPESPRRSMTLRVTSFKIEEEKKNLAHQLQVLRNNLKKVECNKTAKPPTSSSAQSALWENLAQAVIKRRESISNFDDDDNNNENDDSNEWN